MVGRPCAPRLTQFHSFKQVYDRDGNRKSLKSAAEGDISYEYDLAGQFVKLSAGSDEVSFSYNADGSLTVKSGAENASYTYGAFGRLMSVEREGKKVEYSYSPDGKRLGRKVSGESSLEERFTYLGDILFEIRKGTELQKVISGPEIDEIYGITASSGDRFYIRDYLGSVKIVTDRNGNIVKTRRYRAFGEEMSGAESGFGFTSREYDDTAYLYCYRSRYYDQHLGRFTQRDFYNDRGYLSGNPHVLYNPGQLSDWYYAAGNPVNFIDPSGSEINFPKKPETDSYFEEVKDVLRYMAPQLGLSEYVTGNYDVEIDFVDKADANATVNPSDLHRIEMHQEFQSDLSLNDPVFVASVIIHELIHIQQMRPCSYIGNVLNSFYRDELDRREFQAYSAQRAVLVHYRNKCESEGAYGSRLFGTIDNHINEIEDKINEHNKRKQ